MKSSLLVTICLTISAAAALEEVVLDNSRAADCAIYLDSSSSWPTHPPVITDPIYGYIYPEGTYANDDRNIIVADGDTINLSCVGNSFSDSDLYGEEFLAARCTEGQFAVTPLGGIESTILYDFRDLGCQNQPIERSNEPGHTCGPGDAGIEIQYGFDTYDGFTGIYGVCFDEPTARTFYTQHVLWANIIARDTGNDRPDFKPDGYYDFDVDEQYSKDTQAATVEALTGISNYVDGNSELFMSRGHFSPNADFVYYAFQDSTFYFVNVAPQWQCFNGGNWNIFENSCRYYVEDNQVDLIMYTGSHGVLQLADTNGDMVDIYLKADTNQLPAPMYYWRVIYNPADSTGVAIIGVNNPHVPSGDEDLYKVCTPLVGNAFMEDISSPNDAYKGIMYACEVEEAAAVFEEMPDLGPLGILG